MKREEDQKTQDPFVTEAARQANRRLRAQRRKQADSIWFGLGTFGMVGWSIAIPTVIGVVAGAWLDARFPVSFSWRLTLLIAGLAIGCLNAWYWVSKERDRIGIDADDDE